MHLHNISKLINFQGVKITHISEAIGNQVYITLQPTQTHQPCPICGSLHVIRRGVSSIRKIRHLDLWEYQTILNIPAIRLTCKSCDLNFSWFYDFVEGKSRYTNAFKAKIAKDIDGSTVSHVVGTVKIPYTTGERFIKDSLYDMIPNLQEQVVAMAITSEKLVIGIDDFAIRKGHTYNTGIHDLRNGSLLYIAQGRKCDELMHNNGLMDTVTKLQPIAVVMDLAKSYHNFAKEAFPNAIRIADRFHVNRYITEALHTIRKRLTKTIPSQQAKQLKRSKKLLGKRHDSLTLREQEILLEILKIFDELSQVYYFKESLIDWYDYSNKSNALHLLNKWIQEGESLAIPEITEALKTFKNWSVEISNYHYCRFTNAAVEGRNNKIKVLQRRCYFLRNRKSYEYRIYLECNSSAMII